MPALPRLDLEARSLGVDPARQPSTTDRQRRSTAVRRKPQPGSGLGPVGTQLEPPCLAGQAFETHGRDVVGPVEPRGIQRQVALEPQSVGTQGQVTVGLPWPRQAQGQLGDFRVQGRTVETPGDRRAPAHPGQLHGCAAPHSASCQG